MFIEQLNSINPSAVVGSVLKQELAHTHFACTATPNERPRVLLQINNRNRCFYYKPKRANPPGGRKNIEQGKWKTMQTPPLTDATTLSNLTIRQND